MSKTAQITINGIWEKLNNPSFNPIEFDGIKTSAGTNRFILTAKEWIQKTGAIGIQSHAGRYGGTGVYPEFVEGDKEARRNSIFTICMTVR